MADYEKQFSTTAINEGGREGKSSLQDKDFSVDIVPPNSKRQGLNPEELFALGYSACYHSALEALKKEKGIDGQSVVRPTVSLLNVPDTSDFKIAIDLEVAIDGISFEQAEEVALAAHQVCPYSKAIKNGEVDLKTSIVNYKG